jgi:hypothetical protein
MKEKKHNILVRAISNLPAFRLRKEGVWDNIKKAIESENKADKLKKAVKTMPAYIAPVGLWSRIEEQLSTRDENLRSAIVELPTFEAPTGIWKGIEEQTSIHRKGIRRLYKTRIFNAAASIVLLLSLTYLAYRFLIPANDETVTAHIEIVDDEDQSGTKPVRVEVPPILNSQLCKGNPQICHSPQFKELDRQLKELQDELNRIISQPGSKNDPQLLKYYYRLENERVQIEKRMIRLIIQS